MILNPFTLNNSSSDSFKCKYSYYQESSATFRINFADNINAYSPFIIYVIPHESILASTSYSDVGVFQTCCYCSSYNISNGNLLKITKNGSAKVFATIEGTSTRLTINTLFSALVQIYQ